MREKLIKFLCHAPCESELEGKPGSCPYRKHGQCGEVERLDYCAVQHLADHLIANGVTIPVRCKDCKQLTADKDRFFVVGGSALYKRTISVPTEKGEQMKPVLFNTQMVRANLAGLKTNTRRVMKPQPVLENGFWRFGDAGWSENVRCVTPVPCHSMYDRMPYKPGDILYVRENWAKWKPWLDKGPAEYVYMADYSELELKVMRQHNFRWRPSIHMPKELARLFLRVTDVHAEQLQEISDEDILREGVTPRHLKAHGCECTWTFEGCREEPCANRDAYERLTYTVPFSELWDSTMKPAEQELYGWKANPWVWVIRYERCERPEEQ